jgi:hypothetical protein
MWNNSIKLSQVAVAYSIGYRVIAIKDVKLMAWTFICSDMSFVYMGEKMCENVIKLKL